MLNKTNLLQPLRTLTGLFAALVLGLGIAHAEGDAARGEARAASCAACHGPGGVSHSPAMFPTIAGIEAERMVELLQAYRSGEKNNPMMMPQAQGLSDQDILDLAAYFSEQ